MEQINTRTIINIVVFLSFKNLYQVIVGFIFSMGCVSSDFQIPGVTLYSSKSPAIDHLKESEKEKLTALIEKDDILGLAVAITEMKAQPNSEVSDSHMKWMLIHLCCRWDADNCLQYLLKDYFCMNPIGYIDFVNAPTIQGYTCLHLCALWRSEKCFFVLYFYGGLNLNAKDKMMKTPYQTSVQYKCNKMKQALDSCKQLNINFTQVEAQKLISGNLIAEDIQANNASKKKKQSQLKIQVKKPSLVQTFSELEKELLEQKKKLEKEKEQILQSKLKQQLQADAEKARRIAQQSKKKTEEIVKADYQRQIKKQVNQQWKIQQQKLTGELKAKQEQLNRVKQNLKKSEEQRIKKQKQQVQKKAEQFVKLKQLQLNKKIQQKQEALTNLKKQEEEKQRKYRQDSQNKLKQIEMAYQKKQDQMNKILKEKQQQIQKIKKGEEERLKKQKQGAQKLTQQVIKQQQQEYNRKLKQKQEEAIRFKEQENQRIKKQKQQAQKKALQLLRQQNKKVEQTVNKNQNELKNSIGQNLNKMSNGVDQVTNKVKQNAIAIDQNAKNLSDIISKSSNQLKQSFKKLNQQIPIELIQLYQESKKAGMFYDKQFPASNQSIGNPSKSNFVNLTTNMIWLRPRQILKADFKLFDGIDPNDIKQGSLGVCYMLATLSALAQVPKYIQNMFVFSDLSVGFYVLRFYINGKPRFITVDDQIPCSKTTKSPLFTKPIGNQIWVLLLQKAWAKVIGDYLSAQSMTPDHMMEDLSAAPSFGSWFQKEKPNTDHIKTIVKHNKMEHVIVITSGDKKIEGIANNHAYSMLDAIQVNGRYIFKVRNPWGQFQWNGQYGPKSSLWTPSLKALTKMEEKDDGVFLISQNELTDAFCYYSISQISGSSFYSFLQFSSRKNQDLFYKFKLSKAGDVNIRVTQLFDRMLKQKNYMYSPLVFEVGKINSDGTVKFISQGHQKSYFGAKSVHAFENIVQTLQAGQYFIRIRMLWQLSQKYRTAVLAIYGPEPITIEKLQSETGIKLMKNLFISFGASTKKNPTGQGFYKILTMKGQFVFIGQTEKQGQYKITFNFNKGKMQSAELDLNKTSQTALVSVFNKKEPAVGTAMRTQPSKGGTTGPVSILIEKI